MAFDTLSRMAHLRAVEKGHEMGNFRASEGTVFLSVCRRCDAHMWIRLNAGLHDPYMWGQALEQHCDEAFRVRQY